MLCNVMLCYIMLCVYLYIYIHIIFPLYSKSALCVCEKIHTNPTSLRQRMGLRAFGAFGGEDQQGVQTIRRRRSVPWPF